MDYNTYGLRHNQGEWVKKPSKIVHPVQARAYDYCISDIKQLLFGLPPSSGNLILPPTPKGELNSSKTSIFKLISLRLQCRYLYSALRAKMRMPKRKHAHIDGVMSYS